MAQLAVEDRDFVDRSRPGDRLTAFHPFPLTVRGLDLECSMDVQTLLVEPYETPVSFPARSTMTTSTTACGCHWPDRCQPTRR